MSTRDELPEVGAMVHASTDTDFNTLYWRRAVDVLLARLVPQTYAVPLVDIYGDAVEVVGRSRAIDLLCALETQGRAVLESDGYRIAWPEAEAKAARERHARRERLFASARNTGFSR